jgi:hypothetical protein
MQFASIVVAAGVGLGCCTLAGAGANADGQGGADRLANEWTEAQSLRELPPGIQVLLGVGLGPQDDGIADRGENFQAGDVLGDGLPPRRRFVLGLVNSDKALVALEKGGRVHEFKAVEFKQVGMTWEPVRCVSTFAGPLRGAELLQAVSAKHPLAACALSSALPSAAAAIAAPVQIQAPLPAPLPAPIQVSTKNLFQ